MKRHGTQAIAIIHHRDNSGIWLNDCLKTIQTDYPIIISNHDGWVMEGVRKVWETTKFQEIVFLNESMMVKDNAIWDIIFKDHIGQSVMLSERFLMFFGKFRREMVNKLVFPDVQSKLDDVFLGEGKWCREYTELGDHVEIDPLSDGDISDESRFVTLHGRRNLVLENRYFIKYKASYNMETLLANG